MQHYTEPKASGQTHIGFYRIELTEHSKWLLKGV